MLAIWHDVAAGHAAGVREWYVREHHFERLAIPGFVDVRRFDRVSGEGAQVLGLYGVITPQVLQSEAYRARVEAPTEWTRRVMPHFRHMSRTVCESMARSGRAQGGHLAALACASGRLTAPAVLCQRLLALSGVLQVSALRAAPPAHQPGSSEAALRGGVDTRIAWALLVDADSSEAARAALKAAQELTACSVPAQCAVYSLAFAARNPA